MGENHRVIVAVDEHLIERLPNLQMWQNAPTQGPWHHFPVINLEVVGCQMWWEAKGWLYWTD